jgi:hypothetical protein
VMNRPATCRPCRVSRAIAARRYGELPPRLSNLPPSHHAVSPSGSNPVCDLAQNT